MSYERDRTGFEQVFLGEISWNVVVGYHNWVRFYLDERDQKVAYHGYYNHTAECITLQFTQNLTEEDAYDGKTLTEEEKQEKLKMIGGFWIGSTPVADLIIATVLCLTKTKELTVNGTIYDIEAHVDEEGRVRTIYPKIRHQPTPCPSQLYVPVPQEECRKPGT